MAKSEHPSTLTVAQIDSPIEHLTNEYKASGSRCLDSKPFNGMVHHLSSSLPLYPTVKWWIGTGLRQFSTRSGLVCERRCLFAAGLENLAHWLQCFSQRCWRRFGPNICWSQHQNSLQANLIECGVVYGAWNMVGQDKPSSLLHFHFYDEHFRWRVWSG